MDCFDDSAIYIRLGLFYSCFGIIKTNSYIMDTRPEKEGSKTFPHLEANFCLLDLLETPSCGSQEY